ncbi:MAG: HNH endonuclease [Chloroflexi bacterium]|nr:HNH endonuclease [Chloroflexota bacterium]
MSEPNYPKEFLERLKSVTGKRPRTVIDHILEHGFITTEELEVLYGYKHPPRAVRDVRESGIPIETFHVQNSEGQRIAAYRFGDPELLEGERFGGRKTFSKEFKDRLLKQSDNRCGICLERYESRYLQIDHRIPFEVAGDADAEQRRADAYMLVCGSCNRAKSWSCEHCDNWQTLKKPENCASCYWASPESYSHVALEAARRLDIAWKGDEVDEIDRTSRIAEKEGVTTPEYVKKIVRKHVGKREM